MIAAQFAEWLREEGGGRRGARPSPSSTPTTSPGGIASPAGLLRESAPPGLAEALPPNFETPEALEAQRKPRLQRSLQDTAARSFGAVPFEGAEALQAWSGLMDTYLMLQSYVDTQIGAVLSALAAQPAVEAKTVVIFTSDHGEYGGSHGLRGKGASAYEEAIRVPLYVRDFRGLATAAPAIERTQLTSSVDVIALLLTLATGSRAWRHEGRFRHLAARHDLAAICAHPGAPGRQWILHATDEDVTEFATEPYAAEAPRHVVALRTQRGKLALYSNWRAGSSSFRRRTGRRRNSSSTTTALPPGAPSSRTPPAPPAHWKRNCGRPSKKPRSRSELRAPLPASLHAAQRSGMANYQAVEELQSLKVYVAAFPDGGERNRTLADAGVRATMFPDAWSRLVFPASSRIYIPPSGFSQREERYQCREQPRLRTSGQSRACESRATRSRWSAASRSLRASRPSARARESPTSPTRSE